MRDVFINSIGTFLPGEPVPNDAMEDYLGYIFGKPSRYRAPTLRQNRIRTRHYALNENGAAQYTSATMAAAAVRDSVDKSEAKLSDITYLATSTTIGDVMVPGLASHVHAELNLPRAEIANFQSVCASVLMAMKSAFLQVKAHEHDCAAVTGSEFASRYFRPGFYEGIKQVQDTGHVPFEMDFLRFTLSDGAGAALLGNKPNKDRPSLKICWIDIRSYADQFDICMFAGAARNNGIFNLWGNFHSPAQAIEAGALALTQDFHLLKKIIPALLSHYFDLVDQRKIICDEIDHFCFHYSSHALRSEVVPMMKEADAMIDEEKWFNNMYSKGNTGTASILVMLDELFHSKKLQPAEKILCFVPESGRALNGLMLLEVVS